MRNTKWWDYVEMVKGRDTHQQAADRAGFDKSNFSRWKSGSRPDVDFVVQFCRAYGANVLQGMVAAGFITESEAALKEVTLGVQQALADSPVEALLSEAIRRIQRRESE